MDEATAPTDIENDPAEQPEQPVKDETPVDDEKNPAGQFVHRESDDAPEEARYLPAGQFKQLVAVTLVWKEKLQHKFLDSMCGHLENSTGKI